MDIARVAIESPLLFHPSSSSLLRLPLRFSVVEEEDVDATALDRARSVTVAVLVVLVVRSSR
jgi:hypothetical protein